jgi:hypothetical protein
MKSRDEIARQLCRILLDACQVSQDATGEFVVLPGTLPDLLPPQRLTADVARRACSIDDRTWDRELRRHIFVAGIMRPPGKHHPRPA